MRHLLPCLVKYSANTSSSQTLRVETGISGCLAAVLRLPYSSLCIDKCVYLGVFEMWLWWWLASGQFYVLKIAAN